MFVPENSFRDITLFKSVGFLKKKKQTILRLIQDMYLSSKTCFYISNLFYAIFKTYKNKEKRKDQVSKILNLQGLSKNTSSNQNFCFN